MKSVLIVIAVFICVWGCIVTGMAYAMWTEKYKLKRRQRRIERAWKNMADHCATEEDWQIITTEEELCRK